MTLHGEFHRENTLTLASRVRGLSAMERVEGQL